MPCGWHTLTGSVPPTDAVWHTLASSLPPIDAGWHTLAGNRPPTHTCRVAQMHTLTVSLPPIDAVWQTLTGNRRRLTHPVTIYGVPRHFRVPTLGYTCGGSLEAGWHGPAQGLEARARGIGTRSASGTTSGQGS